MQGCGDNPRLACLPSASQYPHLKSKSQLLRAFKGINSMRSIVLKLTLIATSALVAAVFALPAVAEVHAKHHWHHHHHSALYYNDRPLTVTGHRHREPIVAVDPYNGPAAIVTGPNAVAATIVGLPFRVAGSLFPYDGSSPLVVIGAPIHLAGQIAEAPFYAVGSVFGAPPPNGIYY
jgi:hypothetical protein